MSDHLPKSPRDSQLDPEGRAFPVTSWSLIAGVKDSSPEARKEALESLCRRYWKPVYHFVKRAWSKSHDDAKDLTQAFFLQILDGGALRKYSPERGGFRAYLKVLLRGFAADQHDAMTALKRGGGVKILALDADAAAIREVVPDAQAQSPEKIFDWAWKKEILERAVERARQWFAEGGRSVQFRAFEEYDLLPGPGDRPTYAAVAGTLGVSESDVRNYLFAVRERMRTEIRAELAHTVTDLRQLDDEWADLFGA